ncbi:MAG: beta-Ala-His dipeptidase [Solobacterium sp.]|nr:beta-Ala-His dipeptidase [Solobacterium sp.]
MDFDLSKRYCYYFRQLSLIPRGSRNEKAASDYICSVAEALGLPYKQDHVYNVIVDKPASDGYENSDPIILQAHIDMVCEKERGIDHDFERDPIELICEDGWLKARGTTLGADDGAGAAYMLAILEDSSIAHPPLECIFTVQEEIGLLGAAELHPEDLHGHRYISLDGSGVGTTEVACAGAVTARISQKVKDIPSSLPLYELSVSGLLGGHSGGKIHMERGNANIIAGRILKEAQLAGLNVTLSSLQGGSKENAIAREAQFRFVSDASEQALKKQIETSTAEITAEYRYSEPDLTITVHEINEPASSFSQDISDRLLNYLFLTPDGFLHRSVVIRDLTTASLNLGIVSRHEDTVEFTAMIRAADDSQRRHIGEMLGTLADMLGMEKDIPEGYPGWAYEKESSLRRLMKKAVESRGFRFEECATHGGLECGIIKGLDPQMDIITLGPITMDIHSPKERMDLKSFDDAYEILLDILRNCR